MIRYLYTLQKEPQVYLTSSTTHGYIFLVCVIRTFKTHSSSNFQIHITVLLTIVTMLCITSPGPITGSLSIMTTVTHTNLVLGPPKGCWVFQVLSLLRVVQGALEKYHSEVLLVCPKYLGSH